MNIPSINHLTLYIQFWKTIYETQNCSIEDLKLFKNHLAENFEKLRHIKDDDFFEWNHGMIVYLVISMLELKTNTTLPSIDKMFLKDMNLMPIPENFKLSDAVLLLEHIDDRWGHFNSKDIKKMKQYIDTVYSKIAFFVHHAGTLSIYNRWNLVEQLPLKNKNIYKTKSMLIMQLAAKQAWHTQNINIAEIINKFDISNDIIITQEEENNFINWAVNEKTYFSIRKFRTRITLIIWRFLDNLPSRWLHTYQRTGEEPTIYSYVSSKYPSPWINSINHTVLYSKPEELLGSRNPLIQEATVFALIEAYFRTLHNFNWTNYCFCHNYDIKKNIIAIKTSTFPLIVRYWKKFAVVYKDKIYKTNTIVKSFLLWLKIVKQKCNYIILENINLYNTYNTMIPLEKSVEKEQIKIVNNKQIFEINL
tara:strand:- start:14798 stop:16057 length:1260 start_codon:yes stop_codon:yes gene_type:complete